MRYQILEFKSVNNVLKNVNTTFDNESFTQFPAVVGNPNYDAFLIQVDLTDEEVHALPVDEWINFSEGSVE